MPLTKIYKITWPQRVRQIQQLRHTPRITKGASSRLVFGILGMSGALPPIPKNGSGWRIAVIFLGGYTATRFETLHGRSAETFDRLTLFIVCWGIWCRMLYGITALRRYHTFKHLIWCQGILVKANFVPKWYKRATWIDSILTNSLY